MPSRRVSIVLSFQLLGGAGCSLQFDVALEKFERPPMETINATFDCGVAWNVAGIGVASPC